MADDDASRAEDRRLAEKARIGAVVQDVLAVERASFWDRLGINTRDGGKDLDRLRVNLDWLDKAVAASATRNTRLLTWLGSVVGIVGGTLAIIKYYLDWRH